MRREIKEKWLVALRSGEYKQHHGAMTNSISGRYKDAEAFCCLGVGCLISSGSPKKADVTLGVIDTLDLKSTEIDILIDMNDVKLLSFPEIADWIEVNIPTED